MPWFTIIANYSTTITVPLGIANKTIPFNDIAGIGRPGEGNNGVLYNLRYWYNFFNSWKNNHMGLTPKQFCL